MKSSELRVELLQGFSDRSLVEIEIDDSVAEVITFGGEDTANQGIGFAGQTFELFAADA